MNKYSKALAVAAAVTAALSVAATSAQSSGPVTIQFWAHWLSAIRRPTIDSIINTWNKRNPKIQVQYTGVPFDQITTKYLASVASGNPPDLVVTGIRDTKIRAMHGQNTDLSALGADSVASYYFPNLWSLGQYNGHQYALPFVTDTRLLYWNKAAFKEVGLNPENPPRSWADLEKFAAKLDKKDASGNYVRMGFHPLFGEGSLGLWMNNAGATGWDAKFEEPNVNNPTAVKALEWIKKFTDHYGAKNYLNFKASFGGGAQSDFMSGKVAMIVRNSPFVTELKTNAPTLDYGMAPIPTPTGKQSSMSSGGGGFSVEIPKGSAHPKEAFAFAKYFTTEAAAVWVKQQNDFPADKAAVAALSSNPNSMKVAANIKNTFVSPVPVYAPTWDTAFAKAQDDVTINGRDPKAALDEAQQTVLKMVAEGKK